MILAVVLLFSPVMAGAETLIAAVPHEPVSLDPHKTQDPAAWTYIYPCYQRLVRFKGNTTAVEPELAQTWRVSEDRLLYTFALPQDLIFSDGHPVTADAIGKSFVRLVKEGIGRSYFPYLTGVDVIGPHTVRFILSRPTPDFLTALASAPASIVSPGVMEHDANYLDRHTLGSGPFELEEWNPGRDIVLKNHGRDIGSANVEQFQAIFEPGGRKRLEMLQNGLVDMALDLDLEAFDALEVDQKYQAYQSLTFRLGVLVFNCKSSKFGSKGPRQAVAKAVDTRVWEYIMGRSTEAMSGPLPEGMPGKRMPSERLQYDIETARTALKEQRLIGSPVRLLYDSNQWPLSEAEFLRNNLAEAGMTVQMTGLATAAFNQSLANGDFDLALTVFQPRIAAALPYFQDLFASAPFGQTNNPAFYQDKEMDALLEQAWNAPDEAGRNDLLIRMQEKAALDLPYLFLFQRRTFAGLRQNIRGFGQHPQIPDAPAISRIIFRKVKPPKPEVKAPTPPEKPSLPLPQEPTSGETPQAKEPVQTEESPK